MNAELDRLLSEGLETLRLDAGPPLRRALLDYVALLAKWNRVYNLTAVREPRQMLTHHLLDSLAVLPYLNGARVIDVGTGPGLPGIPLALCSPERGFVLLDSNAKKTRFVTQSVTELGLTNVSVVHARTEDYRPGLPFDTVISRAFAGLGDMLRLTAHLCAPDGLFLAMKGRYPTDELKRVPEGFRVVDVIRLDVPGLEAERHLVLARPTEGAEEI